jgi:uncharacterized protein (DUF924 family)
MVDEAAEILTFWFEDIEHSRWFLADPEFDRQLSQRFRERLRQAKRGELDTWAETARGRLALILVLDQFSRNIHRGERQAFEADAQALSLTLEGIERKHDLELSLEERSFSYLPLRHAEDLAMQQLGLEKTRVLNAAGYGSDKYALGHLATIERFGRFPHRNAALGRTNTPEEEAFLAAEARAS